MAWDNVSRVSEALPRLADVGATLWLTGLPASGKTTLANAIDLRLGQAGLAAALLDGDVLRRGLSSDLGLRPEDRAEQARRTAHVAALFAATGVVAIVSLVSPYVEDRDLARRIHADRGLSFCEVWIDTPLAVCERRDPKGLYARARAGEIDGMTGLDAPYQPPPRAELRVRGDRDPPAAAAERILAHAGLVLLAAGAPLDGAQLRSRGCSSCSPEQPSYSSSRPG